MPWLSRVWATISAASSPLSPPQSTRIVFPSVCSRMAWPWPTSSMVMEVSQARGSHQEASSAAQRPRVALHSRIPGHFFFMVKNTASST